MQQVHRAIIEATVAFVVACGSDAPILPSAPQERPMIEVPAGVIPAFLFSVGATHNQLIEQDVGPGLYSYTSTAPRPLTVPGVYPRSAIEIWTRLRQIPPYDQGLADTALYRNLFFSVDLLNSNPDLVQTNVSRIRVDVIGLFDSLRVAYGQSQTLSDIVRRIDLIVRTVPAYQSALTQYRDSILASSPSQTDKNFAVMLASLGGDSETYWLSNTTTQMLAEQTSPAFVVPHWAVLDLWGCAVGASINLWTQRFKLSINWDEVALNCLGWGGLASLGVPKPRRPLVA
jgi:hypothetical protein